MAPTRFILTAGVATLLGFAVVFVLARRLRNYGIVDVAWSMGFAPVIIAAALLGNGWPPRRWAFATLMALWSVRLGIFLAMRVARLHPTEDPRYVRLRQAWSPHADGRMLWFYEAQALLLVGLIAPFILVMRNTAAAWSALELMGAAIVLLALLGESWADWQLSRFKRDPQNAGRICAAGLWRYSRHPNYFFEWLTWVGFAVFAGATPHGWVAAACPAAMLYFLLRVTGIRYTEEQLLISKGEAYRAYQRRTSAFFPWPPRRPALSARANRPPLSSP